MNAMPPLVHIIGVEVIGEQELRLTFEDGVIGDVRFDAAEWRGVLAPLRDPDTFAQVKLDRELGTLIWPGGLDIAPEPLYEEACRRRVAPSTLSR